MPSTSKKQHNLMAAVANNPSFAKKVGIKQSVGADFMKADKGRKFKEGGAADMKQDKAMVKKAVGMHDKQLHGGKKTNLTKLRKGGACKAYKKGGKVRYDEGGDVEAPTNENTPTAASMKEETFGDAFKRNRARGEKTFEYKGKTYSTETADDNKFSNKAKKAGFASAETKGGAALMTRKDRAYKSGGSVRGCGCAIKGKTKGRMV